jgi:hypothetical protein
MERMMKHKMSMPKTPTIELESPTKTTISTLSKWIPLLCAAGAAGVSIIALKEIKNVRKELITLKKEQMPKNINEELNKRMQMMEEQLKLLTDFIKNKDKVEKQSEVIKNVVKESETPIKIINNEEYEEIEVTDDEVDEAEETEEIKNN